MHARRLSLASPSRIGVVVGCAMLLTMAAPPVPAYGQTIAAHNETQRHKPKKHHKTGPHPRRCHRDNGRNGNREISSDDGFEAQNTPPHHRRRCHRNRDRDVRPGQRNLDASAAQLGAELRASELRGLGGASVPADVQQALFAHLTASDLTASDVAGSATWVSELAPAGNDGARMQARRLVQQLDGLFAVPTPDRLRTAVIAYNAYVDASSASLLRNPPPAFLAIQSVLSKMLNAEETEPDR
jgi:hypothetical protein